jgi:hypothetical protein
MSWYEDYMDQWRTDFLREAAENGLIGKREIDPPVSSPQSLVEILTEQQRFYDLYNYQVRSIRSVIDDWFKIKVYRNGSRNSVLLYGGQIAKPLVISCGGNLSDHFDLAELFYDPQNYGFKKFDNTWKDKPEMGTFIPAIKPPDVDEHGRNT